MGRSREGGEGWARPCEGFMVNAFTLPGVAVRELLGDRAEE